MWKYLLPLSLLPAIAFAESKTPSIRYTGAPTDGGKTCATCHTAPAAAPRGSVSLNLTSYTPGVAQDVAITIQDPSASIWGFELTAKIISGGETQQAGGFTPTNGVQVRCDDGTQYGYAAPCQSDVNSYAEQLNAPITTAGSGYIFHVSWTPPINEVGDIRLYVAALAGNHDRADTGDYTYTASATVSAVGACNATVPPTVQKIVNAASFQPSIAGNTLLSIFGLGFQLPGRTRAAGTGDFVNNAFPTVLGCVAVEIAGQRSPITYVQQDQINLQAPPLTAGATTVPFVVILNPDKPNELRGDTGYITTVQSVAPAFFTYTGSNSIAAQFANSTTYVADPSVVPGGKAAQPGDYVTLYGTGFGTTNPSFAAGLIAPSAATVTGTIGVTVGGIAVAPADILYVGLSPGSISGLYQLNIRVPQGVPAGDQPVTITVNGTASPNTATIPVST